MLTDLTSHVYFLILNHMMRKHCILIISSGSCICQNRWLRQWTFYYDVPSFQIAHTWLLTTATEGVPVFCSFIHALGMWKPVLHVIMTYKDCCWLFRVIKSKAVYCQEDFILFQNTSIHDMIGNIGNKITTTKGNSFQL